MIETIQRDLFAVGARLAIRRNGSPSASRRPRRPDAIVQMERWIDALEEGPPPLRRFILAGGSPAGAALHVARTVCRRAERRIVALGSGEVEPEVLVYMNRLSDFLFVLARAANKRAGVSDVEW